MISSSVYQPEAPVISVPPELGIHEVLPVVVPVRQRRGLYISFKVVAEWVIALAIFVLASPLIVALAIFVKATSRGPAFYAQTRLGRGGRLYRIYKLRTMRHDAEAHSGPVWASKQDSRVTPLGIFLRDTHLDELPQLWNVLRGEMSLIGPRPERPEIASRIAVHVPNFHQRLQLRPGVTGLAQMLLPADDPDDKHYVCVRRKLAHDLFYIRNSCFVLDAKISACTFLYFAAAAMEAVRRRLLRSYSKQIAQLKTVGGKEETERVCREAV
jgi:lipopolysaccharide/colanic/teichoic acid biosynthesis glycosyltransferase